MRMAAPRLLPATTVAIAALLGMKGLELVRAATPADALGQTPVKMAAASPAASPAAAPTTSPAGVRAPSPMQIQPAVPSAPPAPSITDGEKTVLQELRQRRQELDAREQAVTAREAVLAAAEHKLDQRVAELQALQQHLEALEAARQQRQDASWQGLVKLYATMKPRDAAKIFDDLDTPVLLEVVDRMNERKAAPILAAMQPDRAREVTEKLAAMRLKRDNAGGN
jgi:flagellar motility protein MotE (MotC chaperone)